MSQPTRPRDAAPPPMGTTDRSRPGPGGPGRGREARRARQALARAVGRSRTRAYGRERARRRVASGRWDPHPGWRNRVDADLVDRDLVILTDQAAAMRRVEQLVDGELWRADKRASWTVMLRRLVCSMSWTTGLICGVTLAQLAEVGDCSPRTVSRLLAWAQDADLLVVAEPGAAAAFLGADRNRAPAYVLVAPLTPPAQKSGHRDDHQASSPAPVVLSAQLIGPVEENGDLPQLSVGSKPLTGGRRPDHHPTANQDWPAWQIPTTPAQRSAAVMSFLRRIGLSAGRIPIWRARALLYQWWAEGACVAGLLHMIDHHPDGTPRGDALRGATDPLRVLGHRLRPWVGHLDALPAHLTGRHGGYRAAQATRIAHRVAAAEQHRHSTALHRSYSTAEARKTARATLEAMLADRARCRTRSDEQGSFTSLSRFRAR